MSTPRRNMIVSMIGLSCVFCLTPQIPLAQESPNSNLQIYRDLRASLLAEGWKPDVHYGLKTSAGRPLYRFPEVVCGPTLCNAKWHDRQGAEKVISLLRGDGTEEYRVAPQ